MLTRKEQQRLKHMRFVAHLEKASRIVATWPLWKQRLLTNSRLNNE